MCIWARTLRREASKPVDNSAIASASTVELLQKNRSATYSPPSDMPLDPEAAAEIRRYALAVLREADALGRTPTPLVDIQAAARLVVAGEITLDVRDRARLIERFGGWVEVAWKRLQGTVNLRSSEIWVKPDLHVMKRRFVLSHEIGHAILPAHKQTFAYVDDYTRMPPFARDAYEREANQAAVEILFQGGRGTDEFDSSPPSLDGICRISKTFGASIIASSRYAAETSKRAVAAAVAHCKESGGLGPAHIYTSSRFESRFGWRGGRAPWNEIHAALLTANTGDSEHWVIKNRRDEPRLATTEKMHTGYAAIVLIVPESNVRTIRRKLVPSSRVRTTAAA